MRLGHAYDTNTVRVQYGYRRSTSGLAAAIHPGVGNPRVDRYVLQLQTAEQVPSDGNREQDLARLTEEVDLVNGSRCVGQIQGL